MENKLEGIKRISFEKAIERYNRGNRPVYIIDNGEYFLADSAKQIFECSTKSGEFGYEKKVRKTKIFECSTKSGEFGYEKKVRKTKIFREDDEEVLEIEVDSFISDKKHVKLTWQVVSRGQASNGALLYVCFIEYKEGKDK